MAKHPETQTNSFPRLNTLAIVAGLGISSYFGFRWGLKTPEYDHTKDSSLAPQGFGFIEKEVGARPAFIDKDKGHSLLLRHIILNHPLVNQIFVSKYNHLIHQYQKGNPPSLATLFHQHLATAQNRLAITKPFSFPKLPLWQQKYKALSIVAYTLPGVLSPYFTRQELTNLGVKLPKPSLENTEIGPLYQLWQLFPSLFPIKPPPDDNPSPAQQLFTFSGKDRAVHFANHFFLAFQYLKADLANLQDTQRMPNLLRTILNSLPTPELKAETLSKLAGFTWETIETIKDLNNGPARIVGVRFGLSDKALKTDYLANDLGARTAIQLHSKLTNEYNHSIDSIINALDNEEFTTPQYQLKPTLFRNDLYTRFNWLSPIEP